VIHFSTEVFMLAFCGILLLCGVVLFLTDFIEGFTVRHGTAVWLAGFGVCVFLLVGFFALYL
jgi:bacteriorhodopsin